MQFRNGGLSMLLTYKEMRFLEKVTTEKDGMLYAKQYLTPREKKRLLEIDQSHVICEEKHWIVNYHELEQK